MKPKRIALVGCGGLGHEIAAGIKAGQAGNYTLCGIYTCLLYTSDAADE